MPPLPVAAQIPAVLSARNQSQGSSLTDLLTLRLPPNTFRNNGDTLVVTASFFNAANANAKNNFLILGSSQIAGVSATLNNLPVIVQAWVTRRAPNSQSTSAIVTTHGGAPLFILTDTTENDNSPLALIIKGLGVATGDIESRLLMVEYIPANSVFGF